MDKRDKMATLLCNYAENGRFVPGTGPGLSQERVPFVPEGPEKVPVCPPDTVPPKMCMFIGCSCPDRPESFTDD